MDDRFTGGKHFWSAICVDRPRKPKNLEENIVLYRPEGAFSDEEKISYLVELTGVFPFDRVMKEDLYKKLKENMIPSIADCWILGWFINFTYKPNTSITLSSFYQKKYIPKGITQEYTKKKLLNTSIPIGINTL